MLSKSQARIFFLGGTILFSVVFLGLTVDMHRQLSSRTNSHNLTESVNRGKMIWEDNNCMGCHTILGEGGYYAPDVTRSFVNRGSEWLRVFLRDPQAMYPGERKMIQYDFTEDEITDVIAFLKWVGEIDTNGWPPEPNVNLESARDRTATDDYAHIDRPEVFNNLCTPCHAVSGQGGNVGPSLDSIGNRMDRDYLKEWLTDPQSVKPGTAMPELPLSDTQVNEVVEFLVQLK